MKTILYNDVIAKLRGYNNAFKRANSNKERQKIIELGKRYMKSKSIKLSNYAIRKYWIFLNN